MALPANLPIQERQRLEKAGIDNLNKIGIKKKLLNAGFDPQRAQELTGQYGPQFKVYGARGPGLLETDKAKQKIAELQLNKANLNTNLGSVKQNIFGKQIGTFIDSKSGQAYSGFQKSAFDIAAEPGNRQQSLSQREYSRSVKDQKSSYLNYPVPSQKELREVKNNKATAFIKRSYAKLPYIDQNLITNIANSPRVLKSNTVEFVNYAKPKVSNLPNLARKYENDIINSKNKIQQSIRSRDLQKLAELQNKKVLTRQEKIEKERLTKIVSLNYKRVAEIIGKTMAISAINLGFGTKDLILALARNPLQTLKALPPAILAQFKADFSKATGGNLIDILELAAQYYTFGKLTSIASKATGSSVRALSTLRPSYVRSSKAGFLIRKTPKETFKVKGKERFLKSRVQSPSFRRPFTSVTDFLSGRKAGQFKKFTKDPGLILKEQTVASGAASLSKQAKLAGRTVTAVNASANQITSWLRRKQLIRKPIPGEDRFPSSIRKILRKFDSGQRLTDREFAGVNKWLQKNVAPNITLLERSLYLDPASGLRTNRLGIKAERNASIRDILTGNFKFFSSSNKPQVLIFENAKVAKFPKYLKVIERKLRQGKKLSVKETNSLIRWQVQTGGGKFKPIGSTIYQGGRELEVTLAPGEYIKRIKQVGFTYIKGKKVTFVTAEIFKPTKPLLREIKLANLGKLSNSKIAKLERFLSKRLGRKIKIDTPGTLRKSLKETKKIARREDPNIPILRVNGRFIKNVAIRGFLNRGFTRAIGNSRSRLRALPGRGRATRLLLLPPGSRQSRSGNKKFLPGVTPLRALPGSRRIPGPLPPSKRPPKILSFKQNLGERNLSKSILAYFVVIKQGGRLVKLSSKPFTLNNAKDFLAYKLDQGYSRTAFFVPVGKTKKVARLPDQIEGYFRRVSQKLRPYRIRYGKRRQLLNGYIERRRYSFDQPGERTKRFRVQNISRPRRISSSQRRVLLARLAKAREVRMRNLRRR